MKEFKKYYLIRISITVAFWLAIGAALLLVRPYAVEIFDVLLIAMGLLMLVMNLPLFFYSLLHLKMKGEWINALISAVAAAFGVVLMLARRDDVLFYLGLFSILFPLIRVVLVSDRKNRVKKELPTVVLGAFTVLISVLQVEEKVFFVCGIAIMALSLLYFLFSLIRLKVMLTLFAPPPETELQQTEQ